METVGIEPCFQDSLYFTTKNWMKPEYIGLTVQSLKIFMADVPNESLNFSFSWRNALDIAEISSHIDNDFFLRFDVTSVRTFWAQLVFSLSLISDLFRHQYRLIKYRGYAQRLISWNYCLPGQKTIVKLAICSLWQNWAIFWDTKKY